MTVGGNQSSTTDCVQALERIVLSVLEQAKTYEPVVPVNFELVLEECCRIKLAGLHDWFQTELIGIAHDSPGTKHWPITLKLAIVATAIRQCPPGESIPLRKAWAKLLEDEHFRKYAEHTLGHLTTAPLFDEDLTNAANSR